MPEMRIVSCAAIAMICGLVSGCACAGYVIELHPLPEMNKTSGGKDNARIDLVWATEELDGPLESKSLLPTEWFEGTEESPPERNNREYRKVSRTIAVGDRGLTTLFHPKENPLNEHPPDDCTGFVIFAQYTAPDGEEQRDRVERERYLKIVYPSTGHPKNQCRFVVDLRRSSIDLVKTERGFFDWLFVPAPTERREGP